MSDTSIFAYLNPLSLVSLNVFGSPSQQVAGSCWGSLPITCIRDCIVSHLWSAKDKKSLQALMQTSRDLRVVVSSMIHTVEIHTVEIVNTDSKQLFPRHATIQGLGLSKVSPPDAAAWLRDFAASGPEAADRLLKIESVTFSLRYGLKPKDIAPLLDAISHLCPKVCRLKACIGGDRGVNLALVQSLGRCLPYLKELTLNDGGLGLLDFKRESIDWSACIPPKLTKLSMSESTLPCKLIQHLVQMPTMVEVEAYRFDDKTDADPIETEACAWKVLR